MSSGELRVNSGWSQGENRVKLEWKWLPFNIIVILGTGQIGSCSRTSIWYNIIYCLAKNKSIFPPLFILISRIFPKISKSNPSAWPRVLSRRHHFRPRTRVPRTRRKFDKARTCYHHSCNFPISKSFPADAGFLFHSWKHL